MNRSVATTGDLKAEHGDTPLFLDSMIVDSHGEMGPPSPRVPE